MSQQILTERLYEALIDGDRAAARSIVEETHKQGVKAEQLVTDLFWPTYQMIEKFFRADQMTTLAHHFSTRLLRVLCDQAAQQFKFNDRIDRTVFAVCGPTDADELAGQIATDLLEAAGFTISYAGSGIASDEILAHVQMNHPDALLLFASAAADLPGIREMIDRMGEIGACRNTQIVVGGGVFARADELAEEIGADLWADQPHELVGEMVDFPERRATADQRTVGRKRTPNIRAA
jgi:methanogenic corrinoid protein MtbC1